MRGIARIGALWLLAASGLTAAADAALAAPPAPSPAPSPALAPAPAPALASALAFAPPPATPPVGSPLPGIVPQTPAEVSPVPPVPAVPPTSVAAQNFAIHSAVIEGATAYPQAVLNTYLAGLTGPAVPLSQIEAARAGLLTRYRQDGYSYTSVRVRIKSGALRVVVTEPRIVAVKLSQDIGPAGVQVLRFLNHLADGRLLNADDLFRWVLLANDVPGVTVRVVLDPAANDPGALTLRAVVERQAWSGSIRADNRAFRQTGPEELLATGDANSFTSLGEKTEISLYHTFNDTDTFGQASEEFFIGGSGLKLRLYFGNGESIPSGSLRALGYDGITRIFGGELSYPVIRSKQHNLNISASFDGVESDIAYNVQGRPQRISYDSLRVLRLDALDTYSDTWLGSAFPANDTADATISKGLPVFGATPDDRPAVEKAEIPRAHERIDFSKFYLHLDRLQSLFTPYTYQGTPAEVQLDLNAQGEYSPNILPPEEKFYLGGPDFNRGFYYGEVTGDRAVAARAQPQLVTALPAVPRTPIIPLATFYGFFDWGEVWQNQSTDLGHRLTSLGGGVKALFGDHLELDVEGVSRLTRNPLGSAGSGSRLKSEAVYWAAVVHF